MTRILLIEDDNDLRDMVKRVLITNGYDVQEAIDGKQAAILYQQSPPDLVITDIVMPEADGLEVIMDLRRQSKETTIIAVSGGGLGGAKTYLDSAHLLGAAFTLEKPFALVDLLHLVNEAVGTPCQSVDRRLP